MLRKQIAKRSTQHGVVALTNKARQVGLQHKVFHSYDGRIHTPVVHLRIVSQGEETPARETLGQGEAQRHFALGVGAQSRVEEGCFIEILSHTIGGLGYGLFFLGACLCGRKTANNNFF